MPNRQLQTLPAPASRPGNDWRELAWWLGVASAIVGAYALLRGPLPPPVQEPPRYRVPSMLATVLGACPSSLGWHNGMTVQIDPFVSPGRSMMVFTESCVDGRRFQPEDVRHYWRLVISDVRQDLVKGTCRMTSPGVNGEDCAIELVTACSPSTD